MTLSHNNESEECSYDDCNNPVKAFGYCNTHYQRLRRDNPALLQEARDSKVPRTCLFFDCGLPHKGNGLCKAHNRRLWMYGLTYDKFKELWDKTDGNCGVCSKPLDAKMNIDHDHDCCAYSKGKPYCGKCIRGFVCIHCNLVLGHAKNDPAVLIAAAKYLEDYLATKE
jgi:hypothetical protein